MKRIKIFIPILCCLAACILPFPSVSAESTPLKNDCTIIGLDLSTLNELQIIDAGSRDDFLHWAVWSQKSEGGLSVKLALLKYTDKGPVVLQMLERKDAYEPSIKRIYQWRFGKYPVLALTYQYGAAAEQLEILGIDNNSRPVLLDEQLGDVIQWGTCKGQIIVGIYSRPEGQLVPSWYRWREETHKMYQIHCVPE
ncbi:MAG: hypothetical protein ABFD63_10190 [Smithella sp.]